MRNVIDRLADLGTVTSGNEDPTQAVVATDLARGRHALHRRRVRSGAALSAAVVVIGGAAAVAAAENSGGGSPSAGKIPPVSSPATMIPTQHHHHHPASLPKIKLVAYKGADPEGFKVASIPQGYDLDRQASTPFMFVVARKGDNSSPDSFVGKLVVTAESASELGKLSSFGTKDVTIDGQPGRLADDGTATQIRWQVDGDVVIDVQSWDSIGLSQQQVVDFADGVTTTPQLQLSHG